MTHNDDETTRLLSDHLRALLRYSFAIVAITALTIGAGVAFWSYQPVTYTTTSSVLVSPVALQPGQSLVTSEKLDDMTTERRLAASWVVSTDAVASLANDGYDFDLDSYHSNLRVHLVNDTRVLDFTYTSSTPERAAVAVDAAALAFVEYRSERLREQRDGLASMLSRTTSELQAELSEVVAEIAVSQNARDQIESTSRLESGEAAAARARLASQRDALQRQLDSSLSATTTLAMVSVDSTRQVDVAEIPTERDGLGLVPTVAGAGVGGLVIGVLFAYLLSAFKAGSQPEYPFPTPAVDMTAPGTPAQPAQVNADQDPESAPDVKPLFDVKPPVADPVAPAKPQAQPKTLPAPENDEVAAAAPVDSELPTVTPASPQPPKAEAESESETESKPETGSESAQADDELPPLTWKPLEAPRRAIDYQSGSESLGSGRAEMPTVTGASSKAPLPEVPISEELLRLSKITQPIETEELEDIANTEPELDTTGRDKPEPDDLEIDEPIDELDEVQLAIRATFDPLQVVTPSDEPESAFDQLVEDLGPDLGRHLEQAQSAVASADFVNTLDQLQQLGSDGPVTVAAVGDGLDDPALAVAFQLGVQLAGLGAKALVVDLVTTAPRLHRIADIELAPGAAEILTGRVQLGAAISEVSGVPGLSILSRGGTAGAIEVGLDGSAVARLIGRARLDYHAVLLIGGAAKRDTIPALASLSDAVLVGTEKPIGSKVDSELSHRLDSLASPTLDVVSVAPLPADEDSPDSRLTAPLNSPTSSPLNPPMPGPANLLATQPFVSTNPPPLPPVSASPDIDGLLGSAFTGVDAVPEATGLDASS